MGTAYAYLYMGKYQFTLWEEVEDLLDTVQYRKYPTFEKNGATLLKQWGRAFETVVQMMYWIDVLSASSSGPEYSPMKGKQNYSRSQANRIKFLCNDLHLSEEALILILMKDKGYAAARV